MKFSETKYSADYEILKRRLGGELIVPITVASGAFTNGKVVAGTPMKDDGTVANSASATGILLNTVYEENPNGALVKAYATINTANAVKNGVTIADAAKTALTLLKFE